MESSQENHHLSPPSYTIGLLMPRVNSVQKAGVENYSWQLLNALLKLPQLPKLILLLNSPPQADLLKLKLAYPALQIVVLESRISFTHWSVPQYLKQNRVDLLFCPEHTVPFGLPKNLKVVSMVHGIEHLIQEHSPSIKEGLDLIRKEFFLRHTLKCSQVIISPSTATKTDITRIYAKQVNDKSIVVIPEGVSQEYNPKDLDSSTLDLEKKILESYDLKPGYFLAIGTRIYRKNYYRTIEAFLKTTNSDPKQQLVIVGKPGPHLSGLEVYLDRYLRTEQTKIKLLGFVKTEDLPIIMRNAKAYVNFSLLEGFGLPVLEAMRSQIPLLLSDIPAFHELAWENAYYGNPQREEDISQIFLRFLKNLQSDSGKAEIQKMVNLAWERSQNFTWDQTAKQTLAVWQDLLKNS